MQGSGSVTQGKLFLALAIAGGVAVLEFFGGLLSNSIALLSDSGHMLVDASAISLSLFAIRLAARPHTRRLTYGYHRAEVLAALANGIVLALIAVFIFREGYMRLINPPAVDPLILISVASVGLAANVSMALILREAHWGSIGVRSAFLHVLADTLSSAGVIVGGVIAALTQFYAVDPIIAFIIAGLIVRSAAGILKECTRVLLEGTPAGINLQRIEAEILSVQGVHDIHDLHIWTISSDMHALSVHVVVKDQMVSQSARIVEEISVMLREKFGISHTTVQVESEKTIRKIKHID